MQFNIKHLGLSLGDTFDILDDEGDHIYRATIQFYGAGNKLDLWSMHGDRLAHLQQHIHDDGSVFDIEWNDQLAVTVDSDFDPSQPVFRIEGPEKLFVLSGDWQNRTYSIRERGDIVGDVGQDYSEGENTFGLAVDDVAELPLLVCIAIVMDEMLETVCP